MTARRILCGAIAGAAGTMALDTATYLDMLVRGRSSSEVPAKVAGALAKDVHVRLGPKPQARNRRSAIGALLGYATGMSLGIAWAALRETTALQPAAAPILIGATAMAMSDVPAVATGATDPRTWDRASWLADIVPHLVYGLVTVAAFEAIRAD